MSNRILVVSNNETLDGLCRTANPDFEITVTDTTEDALAALTLPEMFHVVLVDSELPDMELEAFLQQVTATGPVTPILAVENGELRPLLDLVNRLNIFRLLPLPATLDQLETALYDGSIHSALIRREKNLRRKLHHLANLDPLTECYKRRVMEERLPIALKRSIRYAHYLSLILCDVDQLKAINEVHGHRTGDRILTGIAQAGKEIFRLDVDWIGRWDEDTFLILLPETPIRGAAVVAERLRKAATELIIETGNGPACASISAGLTGYSPDTPGWNATMEDILLVAGNCLKQAKEDGGNKVLICP